MKRISITLLFVCLISYLNISAQEVHDSIIETTESETTNIELHGLVLDIDNHSPLPYANIYVLHKNTGAITNEKGRFTIDISGLDKTDTLRFQYIGYKTRKITIFQLDTIEIIYLKEEIINLSETVIFGTTPDLEAIVENVLIYKDSNYRKTTSKGQTFIREREIGDIVDFKLKYKKSSIDELDREMIKKIENGMPEYFTSYTDFLGQLYSTANRDDSVQLKIDPIRMVTLKEEYLDDLHQLESIFESVLANTGEEEYWKVKSGIFGQKLDLEELDEEAETMKENQVRLNSYGGTIRYHRSFSNLNNKDEWEFLHKTGKYKYTLTGGTWVNGEDVYIIDFEPDKSGLYNGRMYISMNTYALIRADYEYAPGKLGRDVHLLGVGYTESQFSGSIYFEKKDNNYELKYFSRKQGYDVAIDRSLALMKKKDRWLFDKTLKELKVGVELSIHAEESVEYLVLEETPISQKQFSDFTQRDKMEIIVVDQFDDNLWRGYSIIEPTQQMKEYKKQVVSYSE